MSEAWPQQSSPASAIPRAGRGPAFLAGVLAALAALAVAELVAGLVAGAPSLVIAVGDLVIAVQPPGAKDLVVALFGSANKLALEVTVVLAAALVAGLLGILGRRSLVLGATGFAVAGVAGAGAALRGPLVDPVLAVLVAVLAVVVGVGVLALLLALARPRATAAAGGMPDWDRRRFLLAGGATVAASVAAAQVGRGLLVGRPVAPADLAAIPDAPDPVVLPPGAELEVPGLTPLIVPVADFYRIDTALISPRVDVATWTLTVRGMVGREVRLTYDELFDFPIVEQQCTIACVSNEVGGRLVGNALWRGIDLRAVLARAEPDPAATQIVGRSADGWTGGFPTAWAMDPARTPMIAVAMNGAPLTADHGYPARLIIPGLYGYVSATKWLTEIELTTMEAFDAYWIPLGWAKEAPILTQARIDVPRAGADVAAGSVAIAGVAWAPDRGVSAVEVRIDEGDWQQARISEPVSAATWVQWVLPWSATPGTHRIAVRATDGLGVVQTDERTAPAPDGARGHHTITVRVA
ncbi:MAG: molybdopterin-dependent oxidoreductase [Chloroflexota bacterium]